MVAPDRPKVTLVGGTSPLPAPDLLSGGDDREPRRRLWPLLAAALVIGLVAVAGGVRTESPDPAAAELAAELRLEADSVTVTQGGVLVVPVELSNLGAAFEVRRAQVFAEPVRLNPEVQAPSSVDVLESRRMILLMAPDCRLLRQSTGVRFSASMLVRIGSGSAGRDVVLNVGLDPGIQDRVAGLCGRTDGAPGVPFPTS